MYEIVAIFLCPCLKCNFKIFVIEYSILTEIDFFVVSCQQNQLKYEISLFQHGVNMGIRVLQF
jgi:hypothetical protein